MSRSQISLINQVKMAIGFANQAEQVVHRLPRHDKIESAELALARARTELSVVAARLELEYRNNPDGHL